MRVVLESAGFIQGKRSSVGLSGLDRVALAAADDSEGSECGGELEVVLSEASLFDRQRPSQSPFGQRLVAALCVKGARLPSVTATS